MTTTTFIICLWLCYLFYKGYKKYREDSFTNGLEAKPKLIFPISEPAAETFELTQYDAKLPELPATDDGWLSVDRDRKTLLMFAETLDAHQRKLTNSANTAIKVFESDYKILNEQQLQIYRRIFQSKQRLSKFPELLERKISLADLPKKFVVDIPPKPVFLSPKEIENKYSVPVKGIANVASKTITTNGGLKNPTNLLVAAGAMVAITINGKSKNSQLKRHLEITRANISDYAQSLKITVAKLFLSHPNIVKLSGKLKQSEIELMQIISDINKLDPNITKLEQIESEELRKNIQVLSLLLLKAEQHSKNQL